jgi:hypothetical protein
MEAGEHLRDYTNRFFENPTPTSALGMTRSSTAKRKASGTARSLRRSRVWLHEGRATYGGHQQAHRHQGSPGQPV